MRTDSQLLLGLLALQCGFISKEQLVAAFSSWMCDKSQPLEAILVAKRSISQSQRMLLIALVEEHIKQHGNDPEKSLAALSSLPPIKAELQQLADPDINATLVVVKSGDSQKHDVLATISTEPAKSQVGRFVLLRPHAKGGLGQVSVALDNELNRHVALKEILPQRADDPSSQGRFILEAEITGQLEHPGIVPVYGLGAYGDGRPYYAMRFVEGENLKRAIEKFHKDRKPHEQLTGARAVEFRNLLGRFVDVCNAIEYAHSRKVLHRDLKPENILLGPYGETLVVDWGLAKPIDSAVVKDDAASISRPVRLRSGTSSESIDGMVIGTPAYMSPEQAEGRINELGPATDIYALGAVLYSLLTGQPPIQGDSIADTLEKARQNQMERPRSQWASIPRALEAVCLKAMALKPQDRYASAINLADEIEKWLADEPVSAFIEPISIRVKRWVKRHPAIVSSGVMSLLLLFVGTIGFAYLQGAHAQELKGKNEKLAEQSLEIGEQNARLGRANSALITARDKAQNAERLAIKEKEIAQSNLAYATKGNEILGAVFANLAPDQNYDSVGEFTDALKSNLSKAVADLENSSVGDPLIVAQLQNTLGLSLLNLGESKLAVVVLEKAQRVREAKLGPDDSETLKCTNNLGLAYQYSGDVNRAIPILEANLKTTRKKWNEEHPDVIASIGNLAAAYVEAGRLDDALPLLQENNQLARSLYGPDDPHALTCLHDLATCLQSAGQAKKALPLFKEVVERSKVVLGVDHRATLTSMASLAMAYETTGEITQAISLYEDIFKIAKTRLGSNHPVTLRAINNLAMGYQVAGKIELAVPLVEEALQLMKAKYGLENPDTLTAMNNVALLYESTGKPEAALKMFEEVLPLTKVVRGLDHPDTTNSMNNLAGAYRRKSRHEEAIALYEEALKLQKAKLGPDHPDTLTIMNNLAGTYVDAEKVESASGVYRELLKLTRDLFGESDPKTQQTKYHLAMSLRFSGKTEEAIPIFQELLADARQASGVGDPQAISALGNLARVYLEAQKIELAKSAFEELLQINRQRFGSDDAKFSGLLMQVSLDWLKNGQFEHAEGYLRKCLELRINSEPNAWSTSNSKSMLGAALLGQKRFSEAEPLLLSGFEEMEQRKDAIPAPAKVRLTEAAHRLVELYKARAKPEETAKWQTKFDELNKEYPLPSSPKPQLPKQDSPAKTDTSPATPPADEKSASESSSLPMPAPKAESAQPSRNETPPLPKL